MKNILITGITGQDGLFLTDILFKKYSNISIIGTSRNKNLKAFEENISCFNSKYLKNIDMFNVDLTNRSEVKKLIQKYKPTKIYNLTGPSSVYESFKNNKSKKNIEDIFSNLTNSAIELEMFPNFYQASSSEMFGKNNFEFQDELTEFNPNSPYAEAKLSNHLKVVELHEKYNWKIYSGIMFNHESEFRNRDYLIMKIINTALDIKSNKSKILTLGSLDYIRDWSHASDVMNAASLITEKGISPDYVIGSGQGNIILNIVEIVFSELKLNWKKHLEIDKKLLRKGDPLKVVSNPAKVMKEFNWQPTISFHKMIERCLVYKLNKH